MVNYMAASLDAVFGALADPTRRAMLERLARGPATAGELAQPHGISKPAVTKHLRVLENAGLMVRQKHGRFHLCELDPKPMNGANEWIERHRKFWNGRLDSLERYIEKLDQAGGAASTKPVRQRRHTRRD